MKHLPLVLIVLLPLLDFKPNVSKQNLKNTSLYSSINASGRDLSSEHGKVSYSIDQVYFSSPNEKKS